MGTSQPGDLNRSRFTALLVLLGILIGFLFGFLVHDVLVDHSPTTRDVKSWYPR